MRWFVLLVAVIGASTASSAAELVGRASAVDGDTIEIRGERIRLHGIDAPESAQWCLDETGNGYRCGQSAAFALADKIGARNVRCDSLDRDRYGRHVARCFLGDTDLNGWMVRRGHAVAYRTYSMEYASAEAAARTARAGLWRGRFDLPWNWRRGDRTIPERGKVAADGSASERDCPIKGNISGNGKIYHLPGQRDYGQTRIDETRGERWFCSEAEARAAGWRRARK